MRNKFWNWAKDENGRELRLEGVIAESTWYGDDVTPKKFREELNSGDGDITVWINSYGGDCFAASQIYTMLKEYPDKVTVKIDGVAASAASVIAMAGDKVLMSPTSVIMIHNPATIAAGDTAEMRAAIRTLDEIKESIINAYELKTKMSRDKISKMMDVETWLNAKKAVELKFADNILFTENSSGYEVEDAVIYSRAMFTNSLLDRIKSKNKTAQVDAVQFFKRLNLIR